MRHPIRLVVAIATVIAAFATFVTPASATLAVGTTQSFTVNSISHDGITLGISCVPAVGADPAGCMSVGTNEGTQHPLFAIGEPTQTPGYADSASGRHNLEAVSCVTSTKCVAVGWADANASGGHPYIMEYNSGTWTNRVADPADIKLAAGNARLWTVTCFDFDNCVASGSYQATTGDAYWAFVATKVNGTWSAQRITIPGETVSTGPWWNGSHLRELSCISSTLCVGGGTFKNASGQREAFLVKGTLSGSTWTWTPTNLTIPGATQTDGEPQVSCSPDGYCMAIAGYSSSGATSNPAYAIEFSNGAWSNSPILFNNGSGDSVWVNDVSCPVTGICYAVGGSITANFHGLVWEFVDGVPTVVTVDKGSLGTILNKIDCPSLRSCAAMGTGDTDPNNWGGFNFVAVRENGTWSVAPQFSIFAQNVSETSTRALDCRLDGFCLGGGNDFNGAWRATVTPFTFTVDPNNTRGSSGGGSGGGSSGGSNGGGVGSGSGSGSGTGSGTVVDESGNLVAIPVYTG